MNRSTSTFVFCMLLLGLASTRARGADVTITATDVMLAPGGIGTMDFTITSNTNTNDTLSMFGLELVITPVGNPASQLTFPSPLSTIVQPLPFGDPNYVFAGQSFGEDNGPLPFWGPASATGINYAYDSISGGDSSDSMQGWVTLPATADLASVEFQAPTGAMFGDTFQISLVNDPNFTYFDDMNDNPLTYSYVGGLVSVVPEPSSLALAAIAGLSGLLGYWRTPRRQRSPGRL